MSCARADGRFTDEPLQQDFNGLHDFAPYCTDRVWFLRCPKSFFDDCAPCSPFEFLTAISFSFEYVLTQSVFVPFNVRRCLQRGYGHKSLSAS